jgi:hypothetical protein
MRAVARLTGLLLILNACMVDADPLTTTLAPGSSTSTVPQPETTTSLATDTTADAGSLPLLDVADLPESETCSLDVVGTGGEATVIAGGRLYGLGVAGDSPRCLVDEVQTTDVEWGPLGDRIRIGRQVRGPGPALDVEEAVLLEWTAPTGSRIVAVTSERVWKVDIDGGAETDITFLATTETVAYHPAGTHVLAIGTDFNGQYGMWLATNEGLDPLLLAFDEDATMSEPAWSWLGEPLFVAAHTDGLWHVHRVELTPEGGFTGPILVEIEESIDRLIPARYDPVMLAYRRGADSDAGCVDGARTMVNGVDLPEPLANLTSTPVGWLSKERLLVLAFPEGCGSPADLWSFSAGFCPGSVYGATWLMSGIDGAAAREAAPLAPPPPDFTGVIDPAPA